jgi:alanyl-tRNA synthetase
VEGGWDVEACGGTHLSNTSEAGLVKIVNTERVQDGVERLVYAVGPRALEEAQRREAVLMETADLLGAPIEKLRESVTNNLESMKEFRRHLDDLRAELARQLASDLLGRTKVLGDTRVIVEAVDKSGDFLIEVGNALGELEEKVVVVMHSTLEPKLVVTANRSAVADGVNAGRLVASVARTVGGGGGGKPHLGQGGGGDVGRFRASVDAIREAVKAHLG